MVGESRFLGVPGRDQAQLGVESDDMVISVEVHDTAVERARGSEIDETISLADRCGVAGGHGGVSLWGCLSDAVVVLNSTCVAVS